MIVTNCTNGRYRVEQEATKTTTKTMRRRKVTMEMWLVTVILLGIVDGGAQKRSKTVLGCLASTANNHQQKP